MTAKLNTAPPPPFARKVPHKISQLGFERVDDYAWMKDENWQAMMADTSKLDKDIRAHLEAENNYSKEVMAGLSELTETLFGELKGRLKPDAATVPTPDHIFAYNHRYRVGDQHGLYERMAIDPVSNCLLYTSPSPRDRTRSRMPSSA